MTIYGMHENQILQLALGANGLINTVGLGIYLLFLEILSKHCGFHGQIFPKLRK